jgi:hypothetical protein
MSSSSGRSETDECKYAPDHKDRAARDLLFAIGDRTAITGLRLSGLSDRPPATLSAATQTIKTDQETQCSAGSPFSCRLLSYNRGDATGVAALFSENARLGETKGRAEIQKTQAAEFAKTRRRCQGGFDGFKVPGNLAVG